MKHSHYFKDVSHLKTVDVYRVLALFGVTDQAIGHAIKKLLVAGGRGGKDVERDLREAVDSINRALQMRAEDAPPKELDPQAEALLARNGSMAAQVPAKFIWIDWDGDPGTLAPVPGDQLVKYRTRVGETGTAHAKNCRWGHANVDSEIVAYHVV